MTQTEIARPTRGSTSKSVLDQTVTELAAALRARDLRAVDVVEKHIERIESVNPAINAVVVKRYEAAREEARAADERLDAAKGGASADLDAAPLLGVPCTIKEFFGVEGMPQTGGLVACKDHIAEEDATTVARLRQAGAIVLGTTNTPEGGLWYETHNRVYGRTNNPWDLKRTSGGSSGGEGAIVAAGGSPFGLGSDIGGSIRNPAAFCGVFGHKPTGRLVPNTGQWPGIEDDAGRFLVSGPLTRSARDIEMLLRVIAGPDGRDPACRPLSIGNVADVDVRGLEVFPVFDNGRIRVRRCVRQAVERAARALERRGAKVRTHAPGNLKHSLEIWAAMLSQAATASYDVVLGAGKPLDIWKELGKRLIGKSDHTGSALVVAASNALIDLLPDATQKFLQMGRELSAELDALLGDRGVLLHPPYSRPAPRHRDAWRTPFDAMYTAIFNVLEMPVTCAPMGFEERGLPVSVQIVGARGQDHRTIATAIALEEAVGGWVRATPTR